MTQSEIKVAVLFFLDGTADMLSTSHMMEGVAVPHPEDGAGSLLTTAFLSSSIPTAGVHEKPPDESLDGDWHFGCETMTPTVAFDKSVNDKKKIHGELQRIRKQR